jgi:hypothetical protein
MDSPAVGDVVVGGGGFDNVVIGGGGLGEATDTVDVMPWRRRRHAKR